MAFNKIYTPVWIDGNPYAICLPTGGLGSYKRDGEDLWDRLLKLTKEKGIDFHNQNCASWLQENIMMACEDPETRELYDELSAGCRSLECNVHGIGYLTWAKSRSLGFRPCLIPLNQKDYQPEDTLASIADGEVIQFGSMRLNGDLVDANLQHVKFPRPCRYQDGKLNIAFSDSTGESETDIRWIKCGEILVCDRNLLVNISWDELLYMGYVHLDTIRKGNVTL